MKNKLTWLKHFRSYLAQWPCFFLGYYNLLLLLSSVHKQGVVLRHLRRSSRNICENERNPDEFFLHFLRSPGLSPYIIPPPTSCTHAISLKLLGQWKTCSELSAEGYLVFMESEWENLRQWHQCKLFGRNPPALSPLAVLYLEESCRSHYMSVSELSCLYTLPMLN